MRYRLPPRRAHRHTVLLCLAAGVRPHQRRRDATSILQSARECDVQRVVHTSTSEIYGTAQYVPIDEAHPVSPQSPYAASKASADFLALSYHRSFGLPVTVVRPFNTYGPRQSARAIIPTVISQILDGKETLSLGNLTPTRDLTFVSDTVSGFLATRYASPQAVGETVNLGTGSEISIGDLVLKIARIMGREVKITSDEQRVRPAKSEVERLLSNPGKMHDLAGWKADVSLDEGLAHTVEWMKSASRFTRAVSTTYRHKFADREKRRREMDIVKFENVESKIMEIRGVRGILDSDLAELYGVRQNGSTSPPRTIPKNSQKATSLN